MSPFLGWTKKNYRLSCSLIDKCGVDGGLGCHCALVTSQVFSLSVSPVGLHLLQDGFMQERWGCVSPTSRHMVQKWVNEKHGNEEKDRERERERERDRDRERQIEKQRERQTERDRGKVVYRFQVPGDFPLISPLSNHSPLYKLNFLFPGTESLASQPWS